MELSGWQLIFLLFSKLFHYSHFLYILSLEILACCLISIIWGYVKFFQLLREGKSDLLWGAFARFAFYWFIFFFALVFVVARTPLDNPEVLLYIFLISPFVLLPTYFLDADDTPKIRQPKTY